MIDRRNLVSIFVMISTVCLSARGVADDWPQWRGPNRDGVWKETGVFQTFPSPQLKLSWRTPIGSGYCGPTVACGRVFVMDRQVRPDPVERVCSFDAATGEKIWTHAYACLYRGVQFLAGPRASVTLDGGRAYALGTMGHFHCLDAATGKVLWAKDLFSEYKIRMPIWGIAAAPLVEGDMVVVQIGGEKGACLVALDKLSGAERWRALDDPASYSAPIIIHQAGRRVLVAWTGRNVAGLDPANGKPLWQYPFEPTRMVINVPTPVIEGDRLFVTAFYDGSLMLRLLQDRPAVEKIWRRLGPNEQNTDALHAMISTPYLEGDYVYGVDSYGQLRCLDAKTGDRVWEDLYGRSHRALGHHPHGSQRQADVDVQRAGRIAHRRAVA